jgi:hypothetical protein
VKILLRKFAAKPASKASPLKVAKDAVEAAAWLTCVRSSELGVDDATTLIELSSVGTKHIYRYATTVYDTDFAAFKPILAKSVCPSYLNKLLQNGATIEYRYERKEDQVHVGYVTLTKQDCGPYEGKD